MPRPKRKLNLKRKPARQTKSPAPRLYELEVCILGGLLTRRFVKANPVICRTIQIRGDQTLEALHHAIFDAFDREDEHMYEFQVGGKRPMDPNARRYTLSLPPGPFGDDDDGNVAGRVHETTLDSLRVKKNSAFGYWFDFGDDWWHQVTVLSLRDPEPGRRYPRVTARTGASPPQYPDLDEEDDEDE